MPRNLNPYAFKEEKRLVPSVLIKIIQTAIDYGLLWQKNKEQRSNLYPSRLRPPGKPLGDFSAIGQD